MVGPKSLNAAEVRQLERKRKIIKEQVRILKATIDASKRVASCIPKETIMAQSMYLTMMETKLERISAYLSPIADSPGYGRDRTERTLPDD